MPFPGICPVVAAALLAITAAGPGMADDLFDVFTLTGVGRTVAADIADLNGDGRSDVFSVSVTGIPPEESRVARVHLQAADGSFPAEPSHIVSLPTASAVYDLGDLRDTPGTELVLLRPHGIAVVSLGTPAGDRVDLPVPGASTMGAASDERGLERFQLVWSEFGSSPWLWVPQLNELTALSPGGQVLARLEVSGRANFFIPPRPGLILSESDIQIFFDAPRMSVGDVDGDGRVDIVSSTRHEVRVFLRREDGSFPPRADERLALGMINERDHIRGSGGVATDARDIDGDGRVDLLVSHVEGSITDATTHTRIYRNRGTGWDLARPDVEFHSEKTLESDVLVDLDGDSRLELLRLQLPFSVLEVIETLLTREVDVQVSIHRFDPEKVYARKPTSKKKIEVAWSFETFRPTGFVPTVFGDLNGDGQRDLLMSGGGKRLEVYLGGPGRDYDDVSGKQSLPTAGQLRFGDLDGNAFDDFVLFDPHNYDIPIRVGRNRGVLPGSTPQLDASRDR